MSPLGQTQNASEGSVAVQSGGNTTITYHGPTVTEVKTMVDAFVLAQLPAFQAVAQKTFEENAQKFLQIFVEQLTKSQTASAQEFAKPDVQNAFNEALRGCALKGDEVDADLVAKVLVERLSAADKPLLKLVSEGAIRALPNITKQHIALLTMLHLVTSVKFNGITTIAQLNSLYEQALPVIRPAFEISDSSKRYLAGLGLVSINLVADANLLPQNIRLSYPFLPTMDQEIEQSGGNAILELMRGYATIHAQTLFLTSTGQLIGLKRLETVLGLVMVDTWIN